MVDVTLHAQIQSLRTAAEGALRADPESEAPPQLPWKPGDQLTASVEAQRPGERFLVRAGPFLFDVALPVEAEVGQRLQLQFLGTSPRITFALLEEAPLPQPAPHSAPVQISLAARSLSALIQSLGAEGADATAPLGDARPLLASPAANPAQLAAALQHAVERSGLFYESHLAQWLTGERALESLLREPQGRLAALAPRSAPTSGADEPMINGAAQLRSSTAGAAQITWFDNADAVDPQALPQVRAQLDALDARQIVWHGQPWPGQPMDWRIDELPEHHGGQEDTHAWTSRVRLVLPHLGEVTAELSLQAHSLRLRLFAGDRASEAALAAGQGSLAHALDEAGLRLTGFSITHDESA